MRHLSKTSVASLIFGYTFLYLPILTVIVFSFNESRLVTVWSRFSTKWYKTLWNNEGLIDAVLASFKIAAMTATIAVILGTLAAVVMVRFLNFEVNFVWRIDFCPLVMPDVITGLAVLMMFVTLNN
jgi:putrescine transport system permease protein